MEFSSTRIIVGGTLGIVILLGLFMLLAAHASSLISDRGISLLQIDILLSPLSGSEKEKILTDFNKYRAQTRIGLKFDLAKSNAQLKKQGLGTLECTAVMIDFENEARTCVSNIGTNPIEVLFSKCPPADELADKLKSQCNVNIGWR